MQLDLFLDNQRTIRLNLAHDALLSLEFEEAIREFRLLLKKYPGDREILSEKESAESWRERIESFLVSRRSVDDIHQLFLKMDSERFLALRTGLLTLLVQELSQEAAPELIFRPHHFHIGRLLIDLKDYAGAEQWFAKALENGIDPRGRFLAWRGDALFLKGDPEGARECYLSAFLEDPGSVDLDSIRDGELLDLIDDLEMEGSEREEILPALPVRGWLGGFFTLPRIVSGNDPASPAADLSRMEDDPGIDPFRLWFEYLRYAEYLRTRRRDDREMIRARKRMKELAPELFDEYIRKLGMAALPFKHPR